MAELLHEIWIDPEGLESCIVAGEMGDDARSLCGKGSKLIHTFYADSHFTAMTIYHEYLDREPYTTEHKQDYEKYSEEWKVIQEILIKKNNLK